MLRFQYVSLAIRGSHRCTTQRGCDFGVLRIPGEASMGSQPVNLGRRQKTIIHADQSCGAYVHLHNLHLRLRLTLWHRPSLLRSDLAGKLFAKHLIDVAFTDQNVAQPEAFVFNIDVMMALYTSGPPHRGRQLV